MGRDSIRVVEPASSRDRAAILELLAGAGLPIAGLDEHLSSALVVREGDTLAGVAALECYADGALLRSVAVSPGAQGSGIGHLLTESIIEPCTAVGDSGPLPADNHG